MKSTERQTPIDLNRPGARPRQKTHAVPAQTQRAAKMPGMYLDVLTYKSGCATEKEESFKLRLGKTNLLEKWIFHLACSKSEHAFLLESQKLLHLQEQLFRRIFLIMQGGEKNINKYQPSQRTATQNLCWEKCHLTVLRVLYRQPGQECRLFCYF